MELGQYIRRERKRQKLTQQQLADTLGVSNGAIAQWEAGTTRPTLARLINLCNVLGLDVSSFLGGDSPYAGQLVEDADELALLAAFRRMSADERWMLLRAVRGGHVGNDNSTPPQPTRKRS